MLQDNLLKKLISVFLFVLSALSVYAQDFSKKTNELLSKMTLAEKVGQLVQIVGIGEDREHLIRDSKVGSALTGIDGPEKVNRLQKIAVEESRLGIPLLFAHDVIHGCKTIFPIPLAEASSWNPELVRLASQIAAFEAASEGIHWTFAPMVDIARDPRWGRILEGAGEDPFLGSVMAAARVKGFQGENFGKGFKNRTWLGACAKHYVAYGGAEGGRDYNTVDISERTLREIYLPPFKSAVESGAASIMSAFNDLNGIPASANYFTLTEILRDEWKWDGVVVSDYNSIAELVNHRLAKDKKEAALLGFSAGVDVDMAGDTVNGNIYAPNLERLVNEGLVPEENIDEAVKRILNMKFKLGLFDNPYVDIEFFKENNLSKNYKDSIALLIARESIVLLKNEGSRGAILPLGKNFKSIALIGPLADNQEDLLGAWSAAGKPENVITVLQGFKNYAPGGTEIKYVKGSGFENDTSGFNEAVITAENSDVAVLVVGEPREMSGEASSRTSLNLPGVQEELVKRIYETGTPVVVILMAGRPLTINWISENVPAIVNAWFLGDQTGNAVAEVVFGRYNPSGKLPVTFPRSVGQIPLYYNYKSTGRPALEDDKFTSKYLDSPNSPIYPFGYGLSYTSFTYTNIKLDKNSIPNIVEPGKDVVAVLSADITNSGSREGEEVVQLYIQDEAAGVARPVKELKGFQKIKLSPGETKSVSFNITSEMLSFLDKDLKRVVEPGKFKIMTGGNSADLVTTLMEVTE